MKPFFLKVLLLCLFIVPASAQTPLHFEAIDGKTNTSILQLNAAQKTISADGISVQQTYSPAKDNQAETSNFTIKNTSNSERWLYLNWEITWNSNTNTNQLSYWSGKGEPITGGALLKNPSADASMNTTMLQAIYDDKNGIALALPPDQIVSQIHQSLENTNGNLILHLQIPLVLDAGQSDTFPIEIYHFTPRYGFLDALQKYFSAHPDDFNPRTDIDPRAAGVAGSRPWQDLYEGNPLAAFEKERRLHGDWEWFYAPFRRTGDIYTHDKFWDYKPARPFNASRNQPSAEIYRQKRHDALQAINDAGAVPAYYVPSFLYAEEQLAQEQYPGAIIRNPDGSMTRHYTTPWVTYSDNEILMYPWGNKFAAQSMTDAKQLVAENNIPAFGYDIMAGGVAFRGDGMKESPRRAFDVNGEYVDSAVAIAKMADFTRSLKNDGLNVSLVGNATNESRPFLVARSDAIMCEQPAYYYPEELTALRYAAGHKLITFWSAWRLPDLLKTDDMTPAELRTAYEAAVDYTRLASYRYGAFPSDRWSNGVPAIMRMLPLLKEVISEGWQAVPAVRGASANLPDSIWPARYGKGIGSFITLGNADKTDWIGDIAIDNDYLGTSNYLFADVNGKVLSQTVKGRTTILHIQIPTRQTLVLRAIAEIPTSAAGNAAVNWSDNGATGTLNIKSTFTPTKVLSPHSGWNLANQKEQNWNFNSLYFASPIQQIQNFPFFSDTSTAQILLPKNPTAAEKWTAEHIQMYFQFWGKQGMKPAKEIQLPIVENGEKIDRSKPIILIGNAANKIQLNRQTLNIGGDDLHESTLQLLAVLDRKYFYSGQLPTTGSDAAALKKADFPNNELQ